MLFKITFICDEVEDFLREITIDADASFLDLNKAILDACGYSDDQITVFYICDDKWETKEQITREDMETGKSDQDIYIMEKAVLRDFIHDEGQKLIYVFDSFYDRVLYANVTEVITGKDCDKPVCSRSKGKAPEQIALEDENLTKVAQTDDDLMYNDDFYGSDEYDQDDIDTDGFEIEER